MNPLNISVLDHWVNYKERFIRGGELILPDEIWVCDNHALALAKKAFPGARVSLDALCDKFQIDNSHRNLHGALIDADLLASVFIELNGGKQPNFEFIKKDRILNRNNENMDN